MPMTKDDETKMPQRILHHTWTIRTISPFAIPLFSSSHISSLELLQDELTRCLRRSSGSQEGGAWSEGGTYVTLAWIESRHLHVDIYMQDVSVAQIVLCLAHGTSSFSFVLSRGQATACGAVFEFLESNLGCCIGLEPFRPSPADVASVLSTWTTLDGFADTKPLQLVFHVPTSDLDKLTIFVPAVALAKLCREMERLQNNNDNAEAVEKNGSGRVEKLVSDSEIEKDEVRSNAQGTPQPGSGSPPVMSHVHGARTYKGTESMMAIDMMNNVYTKTDKEATDSEAAESHETVSEEKDAAQSSMDSANSEAATSDEMVSVDNMQRQEGNRNGAACPRKRPRVANDQEAVLNTDGVNGNQDEMVDSTDAEVLDRTSRQGKSRDGANIVTESSSEDRNAQACHDTPLLVLRAVQRFSWEAFHINIQSFSMIRASSAVAVLGCDGRCRFTDAVHLSPLLQEIETMICHRIRRPMSAIDERDSPTEEH